MLRYSYIACIVHSDLFLPTLCRSRKLLLQLVTIQHTRTHIHSVEILRTRDRPTAETSTWKHTILTRDRRSYLPARFDFAFPASEQPHTPLLRPRDHWDRSVFTKDGYTQLILLIISPTHTDPSGCYQGLQGETASCVLVRDIPLCYVHTNTTQWTA